MNGATPGMHASARMSVGDMGPAASGGTAHRPGGDQASRHVTGRCARCANLRRLLVDRIRHRCHPPARLSCWLRQRAGLPVPRSAWVRTWPGWSTRCGCSWFPLSSEVAGEHSPTEPIRSWNCWTCAVRRRCCLPQLPPSVSVITSQGGASQSRIRIRHSTLRLPAPGRPDPYHRERRLQIHADHP
jgi:hypothetical protein